MAREAVKACTDQKATDIKLLEVTGLTIVSDYFVICTASSDTNARAIASEVKKSLRDNAGQMPIGMEGTDTGWWVLLDYGDIVVHIFQDDARKYYAIDESWADAMVIDDSEAA
ncbi:ribosome silencing factor [Planctomycetota bacterium]|nr:ribosome silencing factor [Planctomycetota bacterium]